MGALPWKEDLDHGSVLSCSTTRQATLRYASALYVCIFIFANHHGKRDRVEGSGGEDNRRVRCTITRPDDDDDDDDDSMLQESRV